MIAVQPMMAGTGSEPLHCLTDCWVGPPARLTGGSPGNPCATAAPAKPIDTMRGSRTRVVITISAMPLQRLPRKPENIAHRVETGLLSLSPARRSHRPAREDHAVFRAMRQLDPLIGAGQRHRVIADHRSAAQRRESDRAVGAHAGVAVAGANLMLAQRHATALGRSFSQ